MTASFGSGQGSVIEERHFEKVLSSQSPIKATPAKLNTSWTQGYSKHYCKNVQITPQPVVKEFMKNQRFWFKIRFEKKEWSPAGRGSELDRHERGQERRRLPRRQLRATDPDRRRVVRRRHRWLTKLSAIFL